MNSRVRSEQVKSGWLIRYLFINIAVFFYRLWQMAFRRAPVPAIKTVSDLDIYMDEKKRRFLDTYTKPLDYNTNVDACFLTKKAFYEALADEDNSIEPKWRTRIMLENTPRGNIFMYYDVYKQGFAYFSDQALAYPLLNAVAMKYVILYRCRDFFVDDQVTPEDSPSFLIRLQEDEEREEREKGKVAGNRSGPFAKLKNYSSNSGLGPDQNSGILTKGSNALTKGSNVLTKGSNVLTKGSNVLTKAPVKIYNCNKFIYLGKIANLKILQSVVAKPKIVFKPKENGWTTESLCSENNRLSYKEFKTKQVI
jgi:hypothetical protein